VSIQLGGSETCRGKSRNPIFKNKKLSDFIKCTYWNICAFCEMKNQFKLRIHISFNVTT